jgi:hypothetical protein
MLNFNDLKPVVRDTYSFVGLAKEGDDLLLHLPKGFDVSTISTYDQKRDLFFLLYRILRQFKAICVEKSYLAPDLLGMKTPDRDGILRDEDGKAIATVPDEDDPLIFYGKLDWMGALLDANDELKIAALVYRSGRTEKVDYSQLHRFMHQGVFLSNGNIYIDTMTLPRPQVQFESTDIVAMYCYLLEAVSIQLGDVVSPEVTAMGERFRERYLGIEASLFNEQDYDLVLNELKDALDKIDRHTPLKDEDYHTFYEAIERFLYGRWQSADEGEIWGINNFHMVWESMCLTYLAKTVSPESLLWLDRQFVPNAVLQSIDAVPKWFDLSGTFNCNGKQLRPDAVVFPAFAPLVPAQTTYFLSCGSQDDFHYRTTCSVRTTEYLEDFDEAFDRTIKIGYVGQPPDHPTREELSQHYTTNTANRMRLLIDRPLPGNFYSYWSIESESLSVQWQAMKYFNHLCYVLSKQGAWTFEVFKQRLSAVSGAVPSSVRPAGVFGASLFRRGRESWYELRGWNDIKKIFEAFLGLILQFQIIDIKYNDVAYFQDEANRQAIKARSVRKQFVYEYLLQQAIEATVGKSAPIQVDSTFWVPQVSNDSNVLGDRIPYLDGYLQLTPVNMAQLIQHYC